MTKLNLILGLLIVLLFCNVFLFYKLMQPQRGKQPRDVISSALHFSESQNKAYDVLIQEHRRQIHVADDSLRLLKEKLYRQLVDTAVVRRDSLIAAIGGVQRNIEYIHWNHFKDIEALCLPNQKAYFAELQNQMAQLFTHASQPPRH
jgi:hypothetical protein